MKLVKGSLFFSLRPIKRIYIWSITWQWAIFEEFLVWWNGIITWMRTLRFQVGKWLVQDHVDNSGWSMSLFCSSDSDLRVPSALPFWTSIQSENVFIRNNLLTGVKPVDSDYLTSKEPTRLVRASIILLNGWGNWDRRGQLVAELH